MNMECLRYLYFYTFITQLNEKISQNQLLFDTKLMKQDNLSILIIILIVAPVIIFVCCLIAVGIYEEKAMKSKLQIEEHSISNIQDITLEMPEPRTAKEPQSTANVNSLSRMPPELTL